MRAAILAMTLSAGALAAPALAAERSFEVSGIVPASPAEVFRVFMTPQGWKRMGVPFAVVDFRVGGVIETNYAATAHVGQTDNIKNQVLAYVPDRMIAIHNVQAPPNFPYPKEFATTATVFELQPAPHGQTRVVVTGVGYGDGPAYDWLLDKFKEGDAWTLKELADSFAGKTQAPVETAPKFTGPPER